MYGNHNQNNIFGSQLIWCNPFSKKKMEFKTNPRIKQRKEWTKEHEQLLGPRGGVNSKP